MLHDFQVCKPTHFQLHVYDHVWASVRLVSQDGYVLIDTSKRFFTITAEILARSLANSSTISRPTDT